MKPIHTAKRLVAFAATGAFLTSVAIGAQNQANEKNASSDLLLNRAQNLIGWDVHATDGRKIGDIVDFMFAFDGQPRLTHVIVMSGGFLDIGGDTRAVPADAISRNGDTVKVNLDHAAYHRVPVITNDREEYFSDAKRINALRKNFNLSDGESFGDDVKFVSFRSNLLNDVIIGRNDNRLGVVRDAWLNLNDERAPYVEMASTNDLLPWDDVRYVLPLAKYSGADGYAHRFGVTLRELRDAPSAEELDAVEKLSKDHGLVLRLDVARLKKETS